MNCKHLNTQWISMRFLNDEVEGLYQKSRVDLTRSSGIFKVVAFVLMSCYTGRRIQLLLDSVYGSKTYDFNSELRITILQIAGYFFELFFMIIEKLKFLKGSGVTLFSALSLMDASCYYYPTEPALVPM